MNNDLVNFLLSLGAKAKSQTSVENYQGDLLGGVDLSQVDTGDKRPFFPTIGEFGKSMARGVLTGSLDTADSLQELGEWMELIPKYSEFIPESVREQSKQSIRNYIPEHERKYATDAEHEFFTDAGAFVGF
jgi:hypothetical protein